MVSNDFNYWEHTQYYQKCKVCNQPINSTRWCSKECWIKQRNKKTFEEYVDDFFNVKCEKENQRCPTEKDILKIKNKKHWDTLQLIPPKTKSQIKKQYYKLALQYHPDKPTGNHNLFTQLNASYTILTST